MNITIITTTTIIIISTLKKEIYIKKKIKTKKVIIGIKEYDILTAILSLNPKEGSIGQPLLSEFCP